MVEQGDLVEQGQILMEVDLDYVEKNAPSIITPIVFTNLEAGKAVKITKSGNVNANDKHIVEITDGNN